MSRQQKNVSSIRSTVPNSFRFAAIPFIFLGLVLLLCSCSDDGKSDSYPPAIEEIAGTYSMIATLTSATGACEGIGSYKHPEIEMTTEGMDITIHSTAPIKGTYDASDGSFSGSAGVLHIAEGIKGKFSKNGPTITLTGTLQVAMIDCYVTYDVVYTKTIQSD